MKDINKTIKHFEALQKRYKTQHNGKMCERIADALEALNAYKTNIFERIGETLMESDCEFGND